MMDLDTGLLWFDDTPKKPTAQKIADAVDRYSWKYPGWQATGVYVNAADTGLAVDGLVITVARNIRPHYLWVYGEPISPPALERAVVAQDGVAAPDPARSTHAAQLRLEWTT